MPPSPKSTVHNVYPQKSTSNKVNGRVTLAKVIAFTTLFAAATLLLLSFYSKYSIPGLHTTELIHAVAVLQGDDGVNGTIHFYQNSPLGRVKIAGQVQGLDPSSLRGFHIHQYGDLTNGCASTGSHFNPASTTHGAPTDTIRHVGDLGNIVSDEYGVAELDFHDNVISLTGIWSIVGRAVVVHTGTDDLGRGDSDDSKKTGNAGGRAACGVIGLAETSD